MSAVMGALGDPVRARIVETLARGPACVCHLVEDLELKQPNVSNHIRTLRHAGLVTGESRGKFTFYRLTAETLDAAASHLAELARQTRANAAQYRECE